MASVAAVNPAAHEEFLLGRFELWKFIEEDRKRAVDHFTRAIQIDPKLCGPVPRWTGPSVVDGGRFWAACHSA